MKTGGIIAIVVVVLLLMAGCGGCSKYNSLVTQNNNVKNKWANVEAQYQRRSDLIGNLVATVKGAANFEQSTLTKVTEARARATSVQINADNLTPEKLKEYQDAQANLNGAFSTFSRLLVSNENYPTLKATQNFSDLQVEIAGTENRIAVARKDFNDAVNDYNNAVQYFPGNIVAGLTGFHEKASFTADADAQHAPKVDFGDSTK
ncbi:LemA protein [Chitinophaga costaii]|uniref:LemA protein n=1 Tax=Chitinophaga costaii TaxID=1335309 RepID=A0A1C4F0F9_9BACT|nr:LemA family protein [Chitinophaga costaii]PUZ22166.1 LemA family protein [Chitinophaga costaii]SCC49559.1 LemA protein [Chitinophaga costaii]